ncbi:MAG TPA: polysaccharide biosynthesis/export family protein [Bryobacteraceae bacterium]|nr:polysaccharide biosynthesis/export family protein [Bryobacteraceae bacterium]
MRDSDPIRDDRQRLEVTPSRAAFRGRRVTEGLAPMGLFLLVCAMGTFANGDDVKATRQLIDRTPDHIPATYLLSTDDEITIHSLQAKEISDKPFRVDQAGDVNLPMLGRIHVAGSNANQAETLIHDKLKTFYVDPDVAIDITARHTEPASVIGAVGAPGTHQIQGRVTLLDLLSQAGGVRTDAGAVIKITRQGAYGPIPHPSAHHVDPDSSVAEISLRNLLDVRDPTDNITILPHDVVSIPPAEIVYVVGNVKHAGGFPLGGKTDVSVLQALALAEGLDRFAAPRSARILRRGNGTAADRQDITLDVQRILDGKSEDISLHPNDVLFIPNSRSKTIAFRTIEAAIQLGIGMGMAGRY